VSEGEDLDFETVKEDWNEYKLSDGSTLKVKTVLIGVRRLKNQYTPTGDPVYVITSHNVVRSLHVPEKLKRRPAPPAGTTI
jgi:hypothetical protein